MNIDKKQRIMKAAEELFKARQFHEISLDEVAARADVGKGTIYLHFSDKEDLFFQTAGSGFDDMCEMLRKDAIEGAAFDQELVQACQTISSFFGTRRALFRMILAEGERVRGRGGGLRQRWMQHRKKMTQALAEIFSRGVKCGLVRGDIPPMVLAEYLLGMLRTCVTELQAAPEAFRGHRTLVDILLQGVACSQARIAAEAEQS